MIDKLEFLIALAREQHFGRAADACGVTQPTLSAGLKQLESTLGVLLVHRGSRYQCLTPEGERVLVWARRIADDARAMQHDIRTVRQGLTGHLRIAAIPTALAMVSSLTTPFRRRHPGVQFTVLSRNSAEVLHMLEAIEIDAGLTYLDNEPVSRVRSLPLYREQYRLVTSKGGALAERETVTWADVGRIPLCLLTPDMQNRRIIDQLLTASGTPPNPTLQSNSIIVLFAHVRTGQWATVMPERLAATLGLTDTLRTIPIVEPEVSHTIGLVMLNRDPMTPLLAALLSETQTILRQDGFGAF